MGVTREGSHDNITVLGNEVGVDDVVLVEDGGTRGDVSDDPDLLTILSGQSKSVLQESVLFMSVGVLRRILGQQDRGCLQPPCWWCTPRGSSKR